jgi:N-acetylglucosaminyl-diphospho-decaprenol L-rhamnosyltransferase
LISPNTVATLSLSIVSHGQGSLVAHVLYDLIRLSPSDIEVLLTLNLPEDESVYPPCPFPVRVIRNATPQGFGANHNAAFAQSKGQFFVVVNPDIRLPSLNVEQLLEPMCDPKVGAVAPVVLNGDGGIEDSVRRFPTIVSLARRVLFQQRVPNYEWETQPIDVDWSAGMFVVFRRESYQAVNGFDHQRFFMYLEDVDICRRLNDQGWRIVLHPKVTVIHDAQRASRRSLKHMRWHLTSAFRYFTGL